MDVINVKNTANHAVLSFSEGYCYRFNSKIAVVLEKKQKWREAMEQWVYAMCLAESNENRRWAYQRALYCRKQCIKCDQEAGLLANEMPEICFTPQGR
ncbi:ANR family transcriptional regulator [Cedecea neteri]|uniref:PerC family transcriptional regulator n=1 Tax=Cedecea neteri TaxID=158822 RepID=A0A291E3N6_9ENTR|nr:ANR family transcriptional regulator [Cedecea neteri]ATF94526.1 PerC family transcriptional regulator [Cedecea neteri]